MPKQTNGNEKRSDDATDYIQSGLAFNAIMTRAALLAQSNLQTKKNIDQECEYPATISAADYDSMYERNGIAQRINNVYPDECWSDDPEVSEDAKPEMTEWEEAFDRLQKQFNLWEVLNRLDRNIGLGQFGLLVFGTSEAKSLKDPIPSVEAYWESMIRGEPMTPPKGDNHLLYLQTYRQSEVKVVDWEKNQASPRYLWPTKYRLDQANPTGGTTQTEVHWTRCLHVADEKTSSEILGTARLKSVYNYLLDTKKLLASSAEMFWKGAAPIYSFETNPDFTSGDTYDEDAMREEFQKLSLGLERYIAAAGVQSKMLSPAIADVSGHLDAQIKALAISKGIPLRKLIGAEAGQLASGEERFDWNRRLKHRQNRFVIPSIIRPTIMMLMAMGVLPAIDNFDVSFPDLDAPSDADKVEVAKRIVDALAVYVEKGLETLMGPEEFLTEIMSFDENQVKSFMTSALQLVQDEDDDLGSIDSDEEETEDEDDDSSSAVPADGG